MKPLSILTLMLLLVNAPTSAHGNGAIGPILMVHGHVDSPDLWVIQGNALAKASGGIRFYDAQAYYPGEFPATGFQTNGIYGVSYYQRDLQLGQFEPPISPVLFGSTEIPPNEDYFRPFLYQQSSSLAARLANTISTAYSQTGRKVTLICHSMGGLVAEAAIAYYGCENKVERLVTLGSPLRGFPADFRVPTEIVANQGNRGFSFVRETLQMSEGVLYGGPPGGQSFSKLLEDRYKLLAVPAGIHGVNVVGTLNPLPSSLLGPSDGVVRTNDARFRDSTLATVYELPVAHMARMAELWLSPEDSLCLSDRTTQILEKEVLGFDPLPRLGTHLAFNFGTGKVRVTVRNDGGLPVTFGSASGRFDFLREDDPASTRVATVVLSGLVGQTLLPGQYVVVDGAAMSRGEKASAQLTLTINGRELPTGEPTFVANIQAPEIEANLRYDFVNSVLQSEWKLKGGNQLQAIQMNARYRLEGQATYDAVSNRLLGTITARIYGAATTPVAIVSTNLILTESFSFDFDPVTRSFESAGNSILGKTPKPFANAGDSRLRNLYRTKLLSVVTNPGPFVIEGDFAALAGLKLDRPIFGYDAESQGMVLNLNAAVVLGFSDSGRDHLIEIPMQASCSTIFVNKTNGLTMQPRIRRLSTSGVMLGENYRLLINKAIEANEFVVAPAELTQNLNSLIRDSLEEFLGQGSIPADHAFFDSATIAVDPNSNRLRILIDVYDDAADGGQNSYTGILDNGIIIQDRLLNQLLARSVGLVNKGMSRSGNNTFRLGVEIPVPGTSIYFDYPIMGPISIGVGFDGVKWYFEKVRVTVNPGDDRELQILFTGPENKVQFDVPIDAKFYNQIRFYFAVRIGVKIPFVGFVGYTKRWEEKDLRITANETLAVDVGGNVYPYLGTNRNNQIGVRFPPKEIDLDTNFGESKGFLIPILGELVVDPMFSLAKNRPEFFGLVGGTVGGLFGALAPNTTAEIIGEQLVNRPAVKELLTTTNLDFSVPTGVFISSEGKADVQYLDFEDVGAKIAFDLEIPNTPEYSSLMGTVGFVAGAIGGAKLSGIAEDAFKPKQYETAVDLPAGIRISDLTINQNSARMAFDVEPSYGSLTVTSITGYDSTNGVVPLTRNDLAFSAVDGGPFALTYAGSGETRRFSSVWVKKLVSKVRMKFHYESAYVGRYNTNAFPGYSLRHCGANQGTFLMPGDYTYDDQTDLASFTVEVPLLEGQTSLEQISLQVPGLAEKRTPFLVGLDTAPILINAPLATYSGITSNVTVSAGTLVYQHPDAPVPGFVLDELKLLPLKGAGALVDLRPLGVISTNTFGPSATGVDRLYGAQFTWKGSLSPTLFPEGEYAALVTVRESALNRKGSLLIPFIIDRTPPLLRTWTVTEGLGVASRHQDLRLVWQMDDAHSAVLNDVRLTYQKSGGPLVTGKTFAPAGTVMIPGERRLDFAVDMATVPDGVEDLYTLQFHANDVPGNHGVSSNLQFLVDTRPPTMDQLFTYPANSIVNRSNRILTVKFRCPEPVTARILLADLGRASTNDWYAPSGPLNDGSGMHQVVWVLELPELDPEQGLLEGVVGDGQHRLSIELVDRGNNTNFFSNLRTFTVDRQPPIMSFGSQQTFLPTGRTVYPLDLNTSSFTSGDQITRAALVGLNYFTPTSSVASATLKPWTAGQIAGLLASGISLDRGILGIGPSGVFLEPGYYGVEVVARDSAGNESRVTTQFGYQLMRPHVEAQGNPAVGGIVPIIGIAVDPNPADRFPFASRELYWAVGTNIVAPTNLSAINPAIWQKSGFYVLPPRGSAFVDEPNKSAEMVSEGILAYWNSTATALTLDGDAQATISAAGVISNAVTLLLVVRDQGGQAWASTANALVDNRQTDLASLTAPGVTIPGSYVSNQKLTVNSALLRDTPLLQMVVLAENGAAVHRSVRRDVESRNSLFGRPNYSPENDFGFFVWFDEVAGQLKVRCVAPEKNSQGTLLTRGHTFHFSLAGEFGTNDLIYHQLDMDEIPTDEQIVVSSNGLSRISFALHVLPGSEKGVAVNFTGGRLRFNALGVDDYLQALYENGSVIEKRFWRTEDEPFVTPGYIGMSLIRNLVGLDGIVKNGNSVEMPDLRAVANHSGVLGHVFVGRSRTEPISPLNIVFDNDTIQPDLSLDWDLRLPGGSYAEPGNYKVLLYTIDADANRFHGAQSSFELSPADVPFSISRTRLSQTNNFDPTGGGGIIFSFNSSRSASDVTARILNASNQVVATIASGQFLNGRMDTNGHQVWWDGYVNGAPAGAGQYQFELVFLTDGVLTTNRSGYFAVNYSSPVRESDWGLATQPISFDPDRRDRIVGVLNSPQLTDRAWVTLQFDARLSDGTIRDARTQVALKREAEGFDSVQTDTNGTFIPVSSLLPDAVQRFERIQLRFNDRIVDVFPLLEVTNTNAIMSRGGQFRFRVRDPGPKALRLQMIVRAQLKPWRNDLFPVLNELNHLFDPGQVREFVSELEFREMPGTNGVLQSLVWTTNHFERLWGYKNEGGAAIAYYGWAELDSLREIEIRDRNGQQILARFNSWQIRQDGTSAVDQLFRLTAFTNRLATATEPIGLDLVLQTSLTNLQNKAALMNVPVSIGYSAINGWLQIPTNTLTTISNYLDPFPTRFYHADGKHLDSVNPGVKYDNVKAYPGDSGLIQEVSFGNSKIAGHIPFEFALRPWSDGTRGQQIFEMHPWVPYYLRVAPVVSNTWSVGPYGSEAFGLYISSAGDVNGDEYSDVVVGGGTTRLYLGSPNGLRTNVAWSVTTGNRVCGVGDVNGDGYADVLVSDPFYNSDRGRALLYFGTSSGLRTTNSWSAEGTAAGDLFGYSISGAGNVNHGGWGDIIIGSPGYSQSRGRAYVYLTGVNGPVTNPWVTITGSTIAEECGYAVSGAGDVNGDDYADVIVGSPGLLSNRGQVRMFLGRPTGLDPSWSAIGETGGERFGAALSSAGDVNKDSFGDIVIGSPSYFGGRGRAYLFQGSASGLSFSYSWVAAGPRADSTFGRSVCNAGDVNGDGYSDVLIGSPGPDGIATTTREIVLYQGSATGLNNTNAWSVQRTSADFFGSSVSSAGDVDGNGYSDLLVGAPYFQTNRGAAYCYRFPATSLVYTGWVREGLSPAPTIPNIVSNTVFFMQSNLFPNVVVTREFNATANTHQIVATHTTNYSRYTTNGPFPLSAQMAALWMETNLYNYQTIASTPVPLDSNGQTNSDYANYLLYPKYGASTNDLLIAQTPNAYDVVVTNGLIDYTFIATEDVGYDPTINYVSPSNVWEYVRQKLDPLTNGLPAVVTTPSLRPRLSITNIVLNADTNFPPISGTDLKLDLTATGPTASGWTNIFVRSDFDHEALKYFREWSVGSDPNIQRAAEIEVENVRVTLVVSNYSYEVAGGPVNELSPNGGWLLLNQSPLALVGRLPTTTNTSPIINTADGFLRFLRADVSVFVNRSNAAYVALGETEPVHIQQLDLTQTNNPFQVRSARYVCNLLPVISGSDRRTLSFQLSVRSDAPLEYSTRKPLRATNTVALPLRVIDREKFWQVDSGEFSASLINEVALQGQSSAAGYILNSNLSYTQINGKRLIVSDPDYYQKANALFWRTDQGRIIPNPRILLGGLDVHLKDPSGEPEPAEFQGQRYVPALTGDYFHDLYVAETNLENLSWKIKIRPQAKEHAYIKVYGSVGGDWTLSYRKKESGQLSGLLPIDSGSLNWKTNKTGNDRGQNQFLAYWDVTELNGAYILRLESQVSPDNAHATREVKYLDATLGQHLPGTNNPIFSPAGKAQTSSLFSMHGRTQLTSAKEDRGGDDLFFTVNPIKLEEKPFSLGTNGVIPLGERVQVLPHTDFNPFSVNFYIDRQEYSLYDTFRLYHQLEDGHLAEIASLPPSVQPKYSLIQGYIEHTSIVGFLPNPSLRYCTLSIPALSQDGIIRVAGVVDLYGTDANLVKNEDLTVAIIVSPTDNFYDGKVKARLTTGMQAEFPIASQVAQSMLATGWLPGMSNQTYRVFGVLVDTNDNWLTLERQLSSVDEGKHLFNVTGVAVTMTTNVNGFIAVTNGLHLFSPNGDGVADQIDFRLDFQRAGQAQIEFVNEAGQTVHLQSVPLDTNGLASFRWDGMITGQGAWMVAPDGFYTVIARYGDGIQQVDQSSLTVELRAHSKYAGRLISAGITNTTGAWRTLWTHSGGTVHSNDLIRIQYSDTTNFNPNPVGERVVNRSELSALFDDLPINLGGFVPDSQGNLRLLYRLAVIDEVGNIGHSPTIEVLLPHSSRLVVASVSPPSGATNVSTEPVITVTLSNASPFSVGILQGMIHTLPAVGRAVGLSADRRTITVTPNVPFAPGATVAVTLQAYPFAPMPSSNSFTWSFSIISSNLISRALQSRVVHVPHTLNSIGAKGVGFLVVSNAGNVPARVSANPGSASSSVLSVSVPSVPHLIAPATEYAIPVSITVTGEYSGLVSLPLTAIEQSLGNFANLTMNVSISSVTSAPVIAAIEAQLTTNASVIRFVGQSVGHGTISTLARINGGAWWLISQASAWNFEAGFTQEGDWLEIIAMDSANRMSETYRYTFSATPFPLMIRPDRSLFWDTQPGRIYTIESSSNLLSWQNVIGDIQFNGTNAIVNPGTAVVQIVNAPIGRVVVSFGTNHPASNQQQRFFRVRSER